MKECCIVELKGNWAINCLEGGQNQVQDFNAKVENQRTPGLKSLNLKSELPPVEETLWHELCQGLVLDTTNNELLQVQEPSKLM